MREMTFPNKILSACFCDGSADILVSHDDRVSLLTYERYYTKTFEYLRDCPEHIKKIELPDQSIFKEAVPELNNLLNKEA
jgi:hypothetical protein